MSLDFTRCDLTGTLPTQLGFLRSLSILGLGRNDFTGTIPTQMGMLSNLGMLVECRSRVVALSPQLEYFADYCNSYSLSGLGEE